MPPAKVPIFLLLSNKMQQKFGAFGIIAYHYLYFPAISLEIVGFFLFIIKGSTIYNDMQSLFHVNNTSLLIY